jgi:hypothetical protein
MKHIRRTVTLGIMAAVAAAGIAGTAAPAQAWCSMSGPNPLYSLYICSGGSSGTLPLECRASVLGERVLSDCP